VSKQLTIGLAGPVASDFGKHRTRMLLGSLFEPSGASERTQRLVLAHSDETRRRTRLWELNGTYYCSIIGTCLSTADLRQVLKKLELPEARSLSDHDLHKYGVTLAGQREGCGKFLQKALDRKHQLFITRFDRAKNESELTGFWEEACRNGDIPGGYWAVLTHPLASDALKKRVFGEVHMLSHLVGAANRADIRRLAQLEEETNALKAKIERQEAQLKDAIVGRDTKIAELTRLLTQVTASPSEAAPQDRDVTALIDGLKDQLGLEAQRRQKATERLALAEERVVAERKQRQAAEQREKVLRHELELVEGSLKGGTPDAGADDRVSALLRGASVLYVGGHPGHASSLRDIVNGFSAELLYHDGGIDDQMAQLPGLVSQSRLVFFPVDCVSHDAMHSVKRLSRHAGKRYVPLRSAGLTTFLAALRSLDADAGPQQPAVHF
jgi:hypothetical protein